MKAVELTESLSRIAFHYRSAYAALRILKTGVFKLSSTLGTEIEQEYSPPGYPYFLSVTRTRHGGYHYGVRAGQAAALFVLDGNWFNRHYKSKPISYWLDRSPSVSGYQRPHEAEDRVFSKTPEIPLDGVMAVHMYINPKDATDETKTDVRRALLNAKLRGIPAYLYTDPSAWRNFDKSKIQNPDILKTGGKERVNKYTSLHKGWLLPWIQLIKSNTSQNFGDRAKELQRDFKYMDEYKLHRLAERLKNDMSNARKPTAGVDRKHALYIIDYMRHNKLTNIKELVKHLGDKWK